MFAQSGGAPPGDLRDPVFGFIGDDFQLLLDTSASDGSDDTELGKIGAD
ncbi:hypothetical protein ABIF61_003043 [Bradyrhizobium japonicum]|nr:MULTISPECIES: hypothetical protein [unclassified Bradyrhizobium]